MPNNSNPDTPRQTGAEPEKPVDEAAPLDWHHQVSQLGRSSGDALVVQKRTADADELAQVAKLLAVRSCLALASEYKLRALHKGRVLLTGKLDCRVVQTCVVTLVPIAKTITTDFEVEFWPESQIAKQAEEETEIEAGGDELDERDIEPLVEDRIDVGRIVYEVVASGLDPYPRAQGAEFRPSAGNTTHGGEEDDRASEHPFAALAKLKGGPAKK